MAVNQRKQIPFEYPGLDIKAVHLPDKTVVFAAAGKEGDLRRTHRGLYAGVAFSPLTTVCKFAPQSRQEKTHPQCCITERAEDLKLRELSIKDFC